MSDRTHAVLMLIVAAGTAAYWLAWFTTGTVQTSAERCYLVFENAFPLADAYMAAAFVAGAVLLRRRRPAAVPVGIAAGSAMTFLGLMDLLYDLEHGKFADMTPAMAIETGIVLVCLVFGPFTMRRLWAARRRLDPAAV